MDPRLVAQALNYHGQQLQKVWESERNESELVILNLKEPNFEIYQQRQKTLSFSDRGKRLKLQQFIAKKADTLYEKCNLLKLSQSMQQEFADEDYYATMPGLDSFVAMEKSQRIRNFLESLMVGDVIFAQVMGKSAAGLLLKVLCNCSDFPRVVPDLGVKALILNTATVPAVDKKGMARGYMANDLVCVVVGEVNVEAERVVAVMNTTPRVDQNFHPPMGLIHTEDLPQAYKRLLDNRGQTYEFIMENSTGFKNPDSVKYLSNLMCLGPNFYSNMIGLREKFPPHEYALELRQAQASKWAFRSVAEGIDHFKAGRHSDAFQCLNKALTVDPRNVEGLVARGALYANSENFKKAIEDFEAALKLNSSHSNARKYMAETLVALGRSYEDEKKFEEAVKAYENCLSVAPYHEEAKNSIDYIKNKTTSQISLTLEPSFKNITEPDGDCDFITVKKDKKKRKREKKARIKKRQRWSSSSSSSSLGTSSSSSSSDSSVTSSSSGSSSKSSRSLNKKKRHKKDHYESLSPLSKRMAQYNAPAEAPSTSISNTYDALNSELHPNVIREKEDYENKVRKFLEQTKDDSDYEGKVRKFLEETARWKREKDKKQQQSFEPEKSKKKRKKDKKAKDKDEKKNRRKKKKEERKKRKTKDKFDRDIPTSFPDLDQLEYKLNAYYAKVEKEAAVTKLNTDKLPEVVRREHDVKPKEKDDSVKVYRDRDPKLTTSVRKESIRRTEGDLFDQEPQIIHPEHKSFQIERNLSASKWKAMPIMRRELNCQKWEEAEKKSKMIIEDDDQLKHADKSSNVRKQMQEFSNKFTSQDVMCLGNKKGSLPKQSPAKYPNINAHNKPDDIGIGLSKDIAHTKCMPSSLGSKFQPIGQANPNVVHDKTGSSVSTGRFLRSKSIADSENDRRSYGVSPGCKSPISITDRGEKRKEESKVTSRSRSRSRTSTKSSNSGSHKRSRSMSDARSMDYKKKYSRSRSRSYSGSRSRSFSKSLSRSRSRSRSYEKYRKRPFRQFSSNNRGTYYKPRFNHPYGNQLNRNNSFQSRNRFNQNRDVYSKNRSYPSKGFHFGNNRNNFQNRGRSHQRGGRFYSDRAGFRDMRERRDFRERRFSKDRADRSYSPDPMRKVDEAKEKIDKIIKRNDDVDKKGSRSRSRSHSRKPIGHQDKMVFDDHETNANEESRDDNYEKWGEENEKFAT